MIYLIAISIMSIMVSYYYKPLQDLKKKIFFKRFSLNQIKLFGFNKIINCAICLSFWSAFFIFLTTSTLLNAISYACIVVLITAIVQQWFISFDN